MIYHLSQSVRIACILLDLLGHGLLHRLQESTNVCASIEGHRDQQLRLLRLRFLFDCFMELFNGSMGSFVASNALIFKLILGQNFRV